jgi:aspartate aminotransferase-like enzyme
MEQNLRVPGPTPLPDAVRRAQARPMVDHRGTEFGELLRETSAGLAELIGASGDVLLLTGSGTGAMEAAIVNTLSPGDRVLGVSVGAFGERFAAVARAYGADLEPLAYEWGEVADPNVLRDHLATSAPYRAVLLTHNETSTGVSNPLRELAAVSREAPGEPLVIVDGISGLGAMPFEMDAWGVDLVVSASQKAFMASPGVAIAAVGERARVAEETARMPRYYWSFGEARRWAGKDQTPWTPAVSVLFGLRVGVALLRAEGREATWARHVAVAAAAQVGLEALGLRLVARPGHRSSTVTAAWLPNDVEWSRLNPAMRSRGLVVAGGQGKWTGRILRLGHMGDVRPDDVADAVRVMGEVLSELGLPADGGAAADAARAAAAASPRRRPAEPARAAVG